MAVSHVKSNPVANMTGTVTVFNSAGITTTVAATDLVRPVDWNSAHNQYMTIAGNIGANSTASGSNIIFQAAGNVSLFASTDTIIFSAPVQTVQTQNLVSLQGSTGAIVFNNANGVTFGANASTITASHNGLTTARASNDGVGLNTALTGNGVAWTVNSSGLSLDIPAFLTTAAQSGHSHGNPTLALTNLSGTTASNSAGLTLSLSAAAPGGGGGPALSAAGGSGSTGTIVFSNSNGVSFGWNAGTITATVEPGAAAGIAAVAAGTQQGTSGTVTFVNSNGITFGMSGSSQITASHNGLTQQSTQPVAVSGQNGSYAFSTLSFSNANGISFGTSGGSAVTASHNALTTARASNDAIGLNTALTANGVSWTVNSSGLSLNVPAFLTTAALSNHSHGFSASGGSSAFQTLNFANSNGITFSNSNGSVIASHNGLTTAAQSDHSHGNPTLALTNLSGTTASNSAGLTLSLSAAAPGGAASATLYATGNTTQSSTGTMALSSMIVQGTGGVSAGISNGSIVISGPALTSLSVTGALSASSNGSTISLGVGTVTASAIGNTTQTSSGSINLNALVVSGAGGLSAGFSNGTLILSGAAGGGGGMGISAGTQSVSTGTMIFSNSNGVTFGMSGSSRITASVETSYAASNHSHGNPTLALTNLSGTTASNSAGLTLSLSAAAGGGVNPAASASNGSFAFTTLNFSNANNVTFGTSAGGIITASVAAPGAAAEQNAINLLGANTAGNTTATGSTIGLSGVNLTLSGTNASQIVISAPATSSLVGTGMLSISTNGATISMGVPAGTATLWQPFNEAMNVAGAQGNAIMHFAPLPTPAPAALGEVQIDRLCIPLVLSNSSNSSGTVTLSYSFGLYTKNVSTLSLAFSTSYTTAATFSGTVNNSTFAGVRLHTVPWTTTIPDGRYYVAHWSRTTTGGGNATFNQWLVSQANSNYSGIFGANSNRSQQYPLGMGAYSVSFSTAMPSSVAISVIDGTGSLVARPPSWFMISGTA